MRDAALSMDFDMDKFTKNSEPQATNGSGEDTYANVVQKISTLLHPASNGSESDEKA